MRGAACLFISLLCLLTGAVIYLLYKPSSYFIQALFSAQTVSILREKLSWAMTIFPDTLFIKHHLPDMLWYQSLLFIVLYLYHIKKIFHPGIIYYFILLLPFILEVLQFVHLIPGTFDWIDIFLYIVLLFLNYYIYIEKKKPDEN